MKIPADYMKRELIGNLIIVLLVVLTGGIGYLAFRSFSSPSFKGTPVETIVTLVNRGSIKSAGFYGEYIFYCGDTTVQAQGRFLYDAVTGDKYMASYDSLDCQNVKISYDRPVFSDLERTGSEVGEIYETSLFFEEPYIKFKYKIDGKTYERYQIVDKIILERSDVKKTARFPIQYLLDNPKRSIMYFEK